MARSFIHPCMQLCNFDDVRLRLVLESPYRQRTIKKAGMARNQNISRKEHHVEERAGSRKAGLKEAGEAEQGEQGEQREQGEQGGDQQVVLRRDQRGSAQHRKPMVGFWVEGGRFPRLAQRTSQSGRLAAPPRMIRQSRLRKREEVHSAAFPLISKIP